MTSCETKTRKPGHTYFLLLLGYMGFVVYGSLIPLKFHYLPPATAWDLYWPTIFNSLAITSRSNFVANILLFIPLTFLALGALTRENTRRGREVIAFFLLIGAAFFGGGVEFIQLYVPARTVALNDILGQTIGGSIGILFWFLLGRSVTAWARSLWREHASRDTAIKDLIGYLVIFAAYQLFPFDLTISLHEIYHTLKSRTTFIPFTDRAGLSAWRLFLNTVAYVPIGFLSALLVRRKGVAFCGAVLGGFLTAFTIEFLQFFVEGHYPSTTDVVLGTAGAAIGVILADFFGPAARYPLINSTGWKFLAPPVKLLAAGIYLVLLARSRWSPLNFQWPQTGLWETLRKNFHIPFFYQYRTSEFLAAVQIVQEFTLFFFLGLLIASLLKNKCRSILVMSVLAVVLEGGQLFVPSRFFDLTTIGVNTAGGVAGILFYFPFVRIFVLPAEKSNPS
jgi:VanZ family protein